MHTGTPLPQQPSHYSSSGAGAGAGTGTGAPSSSSTPTSASEQKSRKEQFLMFTRVLMKYLEQKDHPMHSRAKEVIRDCAKKNKEGNPAYSSLSASMQSHLRSLVGEVYWKKVEEYLRQYLSTQYVKSGKMNVEDAQRKANIMARSAASSLTVDNIVPMHHSQQQQQQQQQPQQRQHVPNPTIKSHHPQQQQQQQQSNYASQHASQHQPPHATNVPSTPNPVQIAKFAEAHRQEAQKKRAANHAANMAISAAKKKAAAAVVNPIGVGVPSSVSSSKTPIASTSSTSSARAGSKVPTMVAQTPTPTSAAPSSKKKKSSVPKRNISITATASAPKEYSDAMDMLDHVVDYDISSCGVILGTDSKMRGDWNISEEQRKLLYYDFGMTQIGPRKGLYGGQQDKGAASPVLPSYLKGWGERNIVSSRSAWAKLRLLEEEEEQQKRSELSLPTNVQSNGSAVVTPTPTQAQTATTTTTESETAWFNEQKAEEDEALALISEATQQYIKTIIEGAMNAASQRLNLDGIRLWHQQHAAAAMKEAQKIGARDPPLHLRLGCDTKRQYAMVQGNAAKTCQRLEEALSRQESKELNSESMFNAVSMTELSKIPKISSAANKADYNAKRTFEIYGGKESGDPPLGRVPKQAKIMVKDFRVCLADSAFAMSRKRVTTTAFV